MGVEWRLDPTLRAAAQIRNSSDAGQGDAVAILKLAVIEQVMSRVENPARSTMAMAIADLAVTGWAAWMDFRVVQPQDGSLRQAVQGHFAGDPRVGAALVAECEKVVLDRAYSVAWFLSGQAARGDLGWIAVSGEDDLPHRPVNVARTKFPQFDLNLMVPTVPPTQGEVVVSSRFAIATARQPIDPPIIAPQRVCPPLIEPLLPPNDRIILYIHGSDSRLEEADDLIPHLVRTPDGRPSGFSVISMDLPGSSYVVCGTAARPSIHPLDHTEVGPWDEAAIPTTWPLPPMGIGSLGFTLLPFLEQFIVNFVSALSSRLGQPGLVEGRIAAVMGGSLGGNLALRLGRRSVPWLRNVVAYSPGSVWNTYRNQGLFLGVLGCNPQVGAEEDLSSRGTFFAAAFDQKMNGVNTQPDQWYRDGWPCKPLYINNARLDRRETYTRESRRWHWRISLEELLWCWQNPEVQDFKSRVLLGAGSYDDTLPADIFTNTQAVAAQLAETNGDTFFFQDTGHSIHAERPAALARKVSAFVARVGGGHKTDDYDGDGTSDLAVWRPTDGNWYIIGSSAGAQPARQLGQAGDIPVPGDYDGDGKTDLAVWRPADGNWFVIGSSTGAQPPQQLGQAGDIPVPGDYDGDGKTDLAVWRPGVDIAKTGEGNWYILDSSTKTLRVQQWGLLGDFPVPGDYDGDGKTDLAVWRPGEGNWYVIDSSTGTPTVQGWGVDGDIPVPADYNAADYGVWRPEQWDSNHVKTEGNWYLMDCSTRRQWVQQWGQAGDVPMPGDYDGDGNTDFAVWRPGEGNWYIINSSTRAETVRLWGQYGDIPLPWRPLPFFAMTDTPVINQIDGPPGSNGVFVMLISNGDTIYYTTDGTSPNPMSNLYAGEFLVVPPAGGYLTVSAIATHEGVGAHPLAARLEVSAVASATVRSPLDR
jgi:alpha-beta hydrolase superfamily lysophospholipase